MIIRNTQALAFDTIAASGNGLEYNMFYYREWKTILKTPPSVVLYSRSQYQYYTLSGKNHYSLAFSLLYFCCLEIQPHWVYSGEIYFWIFCPAVIVWKPETFAFFEADIIINIYIPVLCFIGEMLHTRINPISAAFFLHVSSFL